MTLPEPVSQGAKWALVVGLAFFSADATSALIQKGLQVQPKPLPLAAVSPIQENVPAQAAPPGLVSLLKTTEPPATDEAPLGPDGQSPSVKPVVQKAPSNLKLRGTMAGAAGSGLAMIDINGTTQVVGTGEEIGGMTVTSVTSYNVRLEGNGQIQLLEMDDGAPTTAGTRPQARVAQVQQPQAAPTPDVEDEEANSILTQRELRNILDNPSKFAGQGFRMKPVLKGGEIIGMRVNLKSKSHPLARLGIQNGDVVKSLNGTPINGPEALSSIYRVLRNTSNLQFEVERGGAAQKVEVTLEE